MRVVRGCTAGAAALFLLGCGDSTPASSTGGTLLIATGGDADAVLPPLVKSSVGKQVIDVLFLPIAHPPDQLNLVGDEGYTAGLATSWEWAPDSLSIVFRVDPRARWHDGNPIRASDLAYSLAVYRAPGVAADAVPHLVAIDSITARDSLTFVAWFARRSPTQFYDLVAHLIPIPEHVYGKVAADSLSTAPVSRAPVGSGKFRFARWLPAQRVEVVADTTHWLGRPLLDRVAWLVVSDLTAQAAMLVAGEADMIEMLQGPALAAVAADTSIRLVTSPSLAHAYAAFNFRDPAAPARPHPLFADRNLRRALTMALDRRQMVLTMFDSLGSAMWSPYSSGLGIEGAQVLPFDSSHAAALLDTLGWRDTDGDGVRQKGDRPLEFSMTPNANANRIKATTIIQQQLKLAGVRVNIDQVDNAVLMANAEAGRFDMAVLGFSGDPNPGALRQAWKSELQRQGSNYGSYSNPSFDATIDSAVAEFDPKRSRELLSRAGQILAEDAPAIWLYEPRTVSGIHRRFRTAVMPLHAWWAHLDQWSVDPAQMKDRDRIGAGTAQR